MDEVIGVECRFEEDGGVVVHRVAHRGQWWPVEQGRQWVDPQGRHVLVILPSQEAAELLLEKETLRWLLRPRVPRRYII